MKAVASPNGRDASRRYPLSILIWAVMVPAAGFAQDPLPQRDDRDPLEFEPQLQLYDVKPEKGGPTEAWAIPADVGKAKAAADRAQRKAQRWQQLQKAGVLSKVEAERAMLQANRAVHQFQQARVAELRKQVESLRARVARDGTGTDLLETAEATLKNSESLAAESEAAFRRTDLQFAENQLERQRRLAAAGLTSKSQVQKAQTTLEQIKATQPEEPTVVTPTSAKSAR
jgi:multidrug resistance efflux pump